jgi:hypothetical protein
MGGLAWEDGCGRVGVEGRLVALESLSTIKKGISPFYFQSKESFSKSPRQLLRYEVLWSKQQQQQQKIIHYTHLDFYYKNVKPFNHFRLLKWALGLSISNRMSPFGNDNAFYKHLLCPQGINNNP